MTSSPRPCNSPRSLEPPRRACRTLRCPALTGVPDAFSTRVGRHRVEPGLQVVDRRGDRDPRTARPPRREGVLIVTLARSCIARFTRRSARSPSCAGPSGELEVVRRPRPRRASSSSRAAGTRRGPPRRAFDALRGPCLPHVPRVEPAGPGQHDLPPGRSSVPMLLTAGACIRGNGQRDRGPARIADTRHDRDQVVECGCRLGQPRRLNIPAP